MLKGVLFLPLLACLMATLKARAEEVVLPAGTLLQCTLDEPSFSSRSAGVGDPILCGAGSVREFDREVFPHGALVAGRFEAYREPGRLIGRGWIKLEFDRLILPDTVAPISARVISVSHFQVDRDSKILGRGHPKRDALGWAIPVLWPVKVFTLPMRGPRPVLQGESRITLKLLEDLNLSQEKISRDGLGPAQSTPSAGNQFQMMHSGRFGYGGRQVPVYLGSSAPGVSSRQSDDIHDPDPAVRLPTSTLPSDSKEGGNGPAKLTLLFLKDGIGYAVTEYWVEAATLRYITSDGSRRMLPLSELDLDMTVRLNRERGVSFFLRSLRNGR